MDLIGLAVLRRSTTLLAICADNVVPHGWEDLARLPNLRLLPSIADRICARFPKAMPGADVAAERYGRWVIQASDHPAVLALSESTLVVVTENLDLARQSKIFLVNGLQMALALAADQDGESDLDMWVREHLDESRALAAEFATSVAALLEVDLDEQRGLADRNVQRFQDTPDITSRMLCRDIGAPVGRPDELNAKCDVRLRPLSNDLTPCLNECVTHCETLIANWRARGG